jgi:hypothetical protein
MARSRPEDPDHKIYYNTALVTDQLSRISAFCTAKDLFSDRISFKYKGHKVDVSRRDLIDGPEKAIKLILRSYYRDLYTRETGVRIITSKYYEWLKLKIMDLEDYLEIEPDRYDKKFIPDTYTLFLEERIREQSIKQS